VTGPSPEVGLEEASGCHLAMLGEGAEGDQGITAERHEAFQGESHRSNWSTVSPLSAKVRVTSVLP
jgi:hypothetical protein